MNKHEHLTKKKYYFHLSGTGGVIDKFIWNPQTEIKASLRPLRTFVWMQKRINIFLDSAFP